MSRLLPYETIVKAREGNPEAMNDHAGFVSHCAHGHFK